jgi:hypothetical protein
VFLALSTLAALGATTAAARADQPITVTTSDKVEHAVEFLRPNPVLFGTGLLTIVGSYTPAFVVASTSRHSGDRFLYVPAAGPWLDLASRGCAPGQTRRCGATTLETAGLVTLGVTHLIGVGQIIASMVVPETRLVTVRLGTAKVAVTPTMLGYGGYGVSASGSF